MRKVKSVTYNWHQNGSTTDRDGAGEDWYRVTVGKLGCKEISEDCSDHDTVSHSYFVTNEDGSALRIFNPNLVEYFPEEL